MSGAPGPELDLTIAGVRLAFASAGGLSIAPPAFEYPAFLGDLQVRRRLEVTVWHRPRPPLPGTGARVLFDTGDGWRLHGRGDERWLCLPRRHAGGRDHAWIATWREPLQSVRLWVAAEQVRDGVVHHVAQYPLDQILLTRALLAEGALLLHAAGADTPAGGIAFAGVSGAGKSTVTRLLHEGAGMRFLSDDRVVAAPERGGWRIHGTPWAGDAGVAEPGCAALAAICFLRQAPAPALRPLTAAEAIERLLPVATLPWFDAERVGDALDAAARLLAGVPSFELAFTRDAAHTRALIEALPRAA